MSDRNDLVQAIRKAASGPELSQAVAALDVFDQAARDRAAADREVDLGARLASSRLTPVSIHETHTAATDWLLEVQEPADESYRPKMIAQASTWFSQLDPAVREDAGEFAEQARGRARTLASIFGSAAPAAEREFLQTAGYLQAQAASGLPQIQQTVDANNMPAETPLPTETFENFAPPVDQFNTQVEDENHGSQISSDAAPMIQQIRQQDSSGSGFGSGPERPDEHSTGFDTSNSYAEVPLGPPGQIGTAPAATDRQVGSTPNPVAGQPQDAGAAQRRTTTAASDGYSAPDPAGFRWALAADEIVHPFHTRCASAHWPDETCGAQAHTASVAVGYVMNLDKARRLDAAEKIGADRGRVAVAKAPDLAQLASFHNHVAKGCMASDPAEEDMAVLHGFMAVVRPVLAGDSGAQCDNCAAGDHKRCTYAGCSCTHASKQASRLDFKQGASSPAAGKCHICGQEADGTCENCGKDVCDNHAQMRDHSRFCDTCNPRPGKPHGHETYPPRSVTGASSLDQVQQTVNPNNHPTPEDDDLPEGVAFPLNPAWQAQWQTGPDGPAPKGGQPGPREAAKMNGLPTEAAQYFGRMDALEGKQPHHKSSYPFSDKAHGQYLRSWNEVHATQAAVNGADPLNRQAYGQMTGRPDLHSHWQGHYDQARAAQAQRGSAMPMTAARSIAHQMVPDQQLADHMNELHGYDQTDVDGMMLDDHDDGNLEDQHEYDHRSGNTGTPHRHDDYGSPRLASLRTAGDSGTGVHEDNDRCLSCGHRRGCDCPEQCEYPDGSKTAARRTADMWTRPVQTTDDGAQVANSPDTAPQPGSANASPQDADAAAGAAAGRADRAAGSRPAFADNSSAVSPYVKAYSEAYGAPVVPQNQDVPVSMGGDNGQALLDQEAQQHVQTAQGARHHAVLDDPDFIKGYGFASKWREGIALPSTGSAHFEAGLYAGVTDRPEMQAAWTSRHAALATRHPELGHRISRHQMLSTQMASRGGLRVEGSYVTTAIKTRRQKDGDEECWKCGDYMRPEERERGPSWAPVMGTPWQHKPEHQERCDWIRGLSVADYKNWKADQKTKTAGVSTDLITDGPGTSPDPMGGTPLNGPGTPPPMGGRDEAATPGGAPPYQGAPPLPGGPVVPDQVMGPSQQPPQPDGPFTNTFSGNHPSNVTLAPVAPNTAAQPGYSNPDAYQGAMPDRTARMAEFRRRVQAGIASMGAKQ